MNFADFQQQRERLLRERPGVTDCGETNLYATLARLLPAETPPANDRVHRCHLAADWGAAFGFSPDAARRALVSCGVRDSLATLFRHYAATGTRLWLPADNYPVYHQLAAAEGLVPLTFPTLPAPEWPRANGVAGPEALVITNPLKPLGRCLTSAEVAALRAWLALNPQRRIVVDAVYSLGGHFSPGTLALLESGQAILLHSLTKGWLQPRLFGVALVPDQDASALTRLFRNRPPPQENLARARQLLAQHPSLPARVQRELAVSRERLHAILPDNLPALSDAADSDSYFFPVAARWHELLQTSNVLGLPASVFGSPRDDVTVLSSLSFIR